MAEKRNTETLVAMEHQPEAAEAMAFVADLGPEERKDFLAFLQGVRFGKKLAQAQKIA